MTEPKITPEQIADAINEGQAVVCFANCYSCMFDCHFDPPQWHTWAAKGDVEHAAKTGQPDPSESRCGCACADAPRDLGGVR